MSRMMLQCFPGYADFQREAEECGRVMRAATAVDTGTETLVQQHFREEVDINVIVRRFGLTGQLPKFSAAGMYGDFSGISDFDTAVERVERTRGAFMALPAEVRDRFRNDPGELVRFASSASEEEFARATAVTPAAVEPPGAAPAAPGAP